MATYPTLPTSYNSDPSPIRGGLDVDRSEDGTGRVRSFFSADKYQFKLGHPDLTAAQKAILDAFYVANRLLTFDYLSITDNVTRVCIFAAPIKYDRRNGEYWSADVMMEQV